MKLATELPDELVMLDRTDEWQADVLYPFALEELLCKRTGAGGLAYLHLWRHPRALVIGLRDSRLPHADAAARQFERDGYSVAVRNSGGAAVPLDLGVVNATLVLPKKLRTIDFHNDFELMYRLVAAAASHDGAAADKGEIVGSYCPGDYDVSIGGRKFCGLAQRRQLNAYTIQAFIVAEGSGAERAAAAGRFYTMAAQGADETDYPHVVPERMASLSELASPVSAAELAHRFAEAAERAGTKLRQANRSDRPSADEVAAMIQSLRSRYPIGSREN